MTMIVLQMKTAFWNASFFWWLSLLLVVIVARVDGSHCCLLLLWSLLIVVIAVGCNYRCCWCLLLFSILIVVSAGSTRSCRPLLLLLIVIVAVVSYCLSLFLLFTVEVVWWRRVHESIRSWRWSSLRLLFLLSLSSSSSLWIRTGREARSTPETEQARVAYNSHRLERREKIFRSLKQRKTP